VARVLIVGGGRRGRRLASALVADGHAVRITTRSPAGRAAIERCGAEPFIGDPARLATLTGALEHVTIACWLLACATGSPDLLRELRFSRAQQFLQRAVDTTVRGFVYEAARTGSSEAQADPDERAVRSIAAANAIPIAIVAAESSDPDAWLAKVRAAIDGMLREAPREAHA
jgi:nucleoside-diphosphate-sugar epimerase